MSGGLLGIFRRGSESAVDAEEQTTPALAEINAAVAEQRPTDAAGLAEHLAGIEREIGERLASAEPDRQALADLREQRDALRRECDRQELLNGSPPERLAKRLRETEAEHDRLTRRIAAVEARVAELRTQRDDAEAAVLRGEALKLYAGADARLVERDRVLEQLAALQQAEVGDGIRWTELRARLRQLGREHMLPREGRAPWRLGARDVLRSCDHLYASDGRRLWPDESIDRIPLVP